MTCVDAAPLAVAFSVFGALSIESFQQVPQALRAKGANPTFKEFRRQGQHFACIPTPQSPIKQASVLVELNDVPQPFGAR